MPEEGEPAPDFTLMSDEGNEVSLRAFRGKKVVLYFYPRDDTPGCTREACNFRDALGELKKKGAVVLGVSADPLPSHQKFKSKYQLTFPLLSDPEKATLSAYGVWKEKQNYGRTFMGIERTTFLIDEGGKIQRIYPRVKVDGHVAQILKDL